MAARTVHAVRSSDEEEVSVSISSAYGGDEPSGVRLHATTYASDDVDGVEGDGAWDERKEHEKHYSSSIGAASPPPLAPTPAKLDPHAAGVLF